MGRKVIVLMPLLDQNGGSQPTLGEKHPKQSQARGLIDIEQGNRNRKSAQGLKFEANQP